MANTFRVLFVDDEPRLRQSWQRLLSSYPDIEFVGTLDTADGLDAAVRATGAHVVLLDVSMPGQCPLDACRNLTRAAPDARVVFYSGHDDAALVEDCFHAGAWGFVDKLMPPDEIIAVLRRVAAGEPSFPRNFDAPTGG